MTKQTTSTDPATEKTRAKVHPDLPGKSDQTAHQVDADGAVPDEHGDHAKGGPNSDRHAAETLAGRLEGNGKAEMKTK